MLKRFTGFNLDEVKGQGHRRCMPYMF